MVSKDQAIGGLICTVCVVIGVLYTLGLFYFGNPMGGWAIEFWLVALPVFIAFIAILAIGAWIGWTMATTPPPKPIEEITSEMETEPKTKVEEKPVTEEKPTMEDKPSVEEKPPEQPKVGEEKRPERKRKT
jgi:predicted DNA-binding transcriptional regulator